jgi:rod shape determining protein RodA
MRRGLMEHLLSLDWMLLVSVFALLGMGLVLIHSATFQMHGSRMVLRQIIWIGLGFASFLGLSAVPVPTLRHYSTGIYVLFLLAVLLTYGFGVEAFGSRRWLSLAGWRFQPSEFLKLGSILLLARFADDFTQAEGDRKLAPLVGMAVVTGLSFVVIAKQPDLGTATTMFAVCGGMLLVMGLPAWALVSLILMGVLPVGLPALMAQLGQPISIEVTLPLLFLLSLVFVVAVSISFILRLELVLWRPTVVYLASVCGMLLGPKVWYALNPYQRLRLTGFLAPELDPRGSGYNLIQSLIAIGSGGVWGQGLGQGSQTNLGFLPHKHTDFIFSVLGEQLGYVGVGSLLLLFVLVFGRLLWLATRARSNFGALVITGVACLLAFQTLVNLSMTMGMAPITGIPLPFVSYGGSAMIGYFMLLGLVQAIALDPSHSVSRSGIFSRSQFGR